MLEQLLEKIPRLRKNWARYAGLLTEIEVPARTVLLREGERSRKMYFVKKGSLRASLNSRGRDITMQFFFENESVASIESFRSDTPSPITITSIEPSTLLVLRKNDFERLLSEVPEIKDFMLEIAFRRFGQYTRLFVSHLTLTPRQRYLQLLKENPAILQRVPQKYIASYHGMTPVSLSRIRRNIRPTTAKP